MTKGYIFLKTIQYTAVLITCYLALEYNSIWTGILCFFLSEYKLIDFNVKDNITLEQANKVLEKNCTSIVPLDKIKGK